MVEIDVRQLTEGDDARRVMVLPGSAYPVELPGLAFPVRALELQGWQVWGARWDLSVLESREERRRAVEHALDRFADTTQAVPGLVLAKSVGTLAAEWTADRGVPAVWTTPLLTDAGCAAAIGRSPAPALLVAGDRDFAWDAEAARESGKTVCLLSGPDHGWRTGDWGAEFDALRTMTGAIARFAESLVD